MAKEKAELDCSTLLVVDDEGTIFIPVPDEDGKVHLAECAVVLTKDEWDSSAVETLDDVCDLIDEIADEVLEDVEGLQDGEDLSDDDDESEDDGDGETDDDLEEDDDEEQKKEEE